MNNRIIAIIFFLFIGPSAIIAQSYLSFGSSGVQHEDTLHIGDSIHFSFWIVNQGSVTINDSVQVFCETFDDFGVSISSMAIGDTYNAAGSLNVGDSILINITELVTLSSYVLGDNIIVIWPASIAQGNVDTSLTPIHILNSLPSGFESEITENLLIAFPNPTSDDLILSNTLGLPMSYITVADSKGNILYVDKSTYYNSFNFSLSRFPSGAYCISFTVNNQRVVKRVVLVK